MRHNRIVILSLAGAVALSACQKSDEAEVERALKSVNAIDESNLGDLMLQAADPQEAVAYFRRTLADNPDRIDVRRGLAKSLVRAKRPTEAVAAWKSVVEHPEAVEEDRISYADALIRNSDGTAAKQTLDSVPLYGEGSRQPVAWLLQHSCTCSFDFSRHIRSFVHAH